MALVTESCAEANQPFPPFAKRTEKRATKLGRAGRHCLNNCHSSSVIPAQPGNLIALPPIDLAPRFWRFRKMFCDWIESNHYLAPCNSSASAPALYTFRSASMIAAESTETARDCVSV